MKFCQAAFLISVIAAVAAGNSDAERDAKELLTKRRHLAFLRRILGELDDKLNTMHKRACLGLPGAIEACDANYALGSSLDREYLGSLLAPGKRALQDAVYDFYLTKKNSGCEWGPNGYLDGCDGHRVQFDKEYLKSIQSPGKRSVQDDCKWGPNGFLDGCDANNAIGTSQNRQYTNSVDSPGKRNADVAKDSVAKLLFRTNQQRH